MAKKAPRTSIRDVTISPDERISLYVSARSIPSSLRRKCGLQLPFETYLQDPFVSENQTTLYDEEIFVDWEPGLKDGPTSARFAVVDYNADTGKLEPPAEWDEKRQTFVSGGVPLDRKGGQPQFHQMSVWAQVQRALAFFEDGNGLGRPIPWGFEGNRLIVVPHAGYGENAYYDRASKSLQFYYFQNGDKTVYTCLSSDIVCHEFGHAVLDGVRPLLNESVMPETAAFHESLGDLSAILLTLRNNTLRTRLALATEGRLDKATELSSIAEEFGNAVSNRPYLRSAVNTYTMSDKANVTEPHDLSEVLTGAMFEVLVNIGNGYQKDPDPPESAEATERRRKATPKQAFWYAAERMQRMAIQPLDLLPPVDVNFRDYAIAVCRSQKLSDPLDPRGYYNMLIDVFVKREILTKADATELRKPGYLTDRFRLGVRHNINFISRSRAAAYRFLNDNRENLLIPVNQDFLVADMYDAEKRGRQNVPLPRQIVIEYVWREPVPLKGPEFGKFEGQTAALLCGGTLVFTDDGNILSWAMKPGSLPYGGKQPSTGILADTWDRAVKEGSARRAAMLAAIAAQIAGGSIGSIAGSSKGMLESQVPPMTADDDGEFVRFHLSPHMNLSNHKVEDTGARQWELSC